MKNKFLLVVLIGVLSFEGYAQKSVPSRPDFNRWSIDGGIGLTKPYHRFSQEYWSATPDFFSGDIGVRYMLNEYFGLKADFGYNHFTNADKSKDFSTNSYRIDFQGVANVGRVLKFEEWTKTLNLLVHGGFGLGGLDYDSFSSLDHVGNAIAGITGQVKLSPRVAFNLDLSVLVNIRQQEGFDGHYPYTGSDVKGFVFDGTAGISYYLGKNKEHADWIVRTDDYSDLYNQIAALEDEMKSGKREDPRLQQIDDLNRRMNNLDKKVDAISVPKPETYDDLIRQIINGGYLNIYFDYNSANIDKTSTGVLNALRTYLRDNPEKNVMMSGYADERGTDEYNMKLSEERAKAVAKVLVKAGIDSSRIHAEGKGEDKSVDPKSPEARRLARRVSFTVK